MEARRSTLNPALAQAAQWAWLLVCALLPISGGLVPVPLAVAVVLCAVVAARHRPTIDLRLLWPLFAWYALHVLGMAWTTDTGFGLFDLQVKLGVLLLPVAAAIVITAFPGMPRRSMVAFTAGVLLSIVPGLWKAWDCWAGTGASSCFSQSTLSYDLHPSYAAWYACWAMAWWGHRLITGRVGKGRIAVVAMLAVLLVWTAMLASKSGVVGLGLVVACLAVLVLRRARGRARALAIGGLLLALLVAAWAQGPLVRARMVASVDAVQRAMAGDATMLTSADGNDLRMVAWTCSVQCLRTGPWGAGTGDIKHALMDCYGAKGATEAAKRDLNSHSQFLQGAVALGWPGLLSTLLLALVPLLRGWRDRNVPLLVFMALFVVNAAVESVLEVQAGVLFFGLFIGLLAAQARSSPMPSPSAP